MSPEDLRSFEKFNYLLRPSKQVERKLLIEALHRLSSSGFPIRTYTYFGLGSIYYADFILFYKYLYMQKMICVEGEPIPKRMEFNLPFPFIQLKMKRVSDVLPSLDRDEKYFAWLDYDNRLDDEAIRDISSLIQILAPGSVFLITVDADPRFHGLWDNEDSVERRDGMILAELQRSWGRFCSMPIARKMLTPHGLPPLIAEVIRSVVNESALARPDGLISFSQLFNFSYKDGAQMLSLGGMVCDPATKEKLEASRIESIDWINREQEPIRISVPQLTVREKQWLDCRLTASLGVDELAFELDPDHLENYRRYQKHYPTYYETLT